jgi:hypothetical protein
MLSEDCEKEKVARYGLCSPIMRQVIVTAFSG